MNEVSALIKVMIEFVYSLYSLPCEDTMKCWQQSATQKRTLTRTSTLLALRLPAPRTVKNILLSHISHLIYGLFDVKAQMD